MAQQATNPKIEELRFRIKTDPKSRLFYQLAEELRKVRSYEEAEQVLRAGLTHNPTYLAAWVSLGRTLRELGKHQEAIEALNKALQLDPGNVVAARQMADAYLDLGDKVEAIKKYKLVRALLPVDEELNATIDKLEDEINPITIHNEQPESEPAAEQTQPGRARRLPAEMPEESPFEDAAKTLEEEHKIEAQTGDVEPMLASHEESPFEEPAADYTAAAVDIEQPLGMSVEPAPMTADVANTITMAELYVQQGHLDRAQSIYESILDRDPTNDEVRGKLDALENASRPQPAPARNPKVDRLEQWLAKVKRAEEPRV